MTTTAFSCKDLAYAEWDLILCRTTIFNSLLFTRISAATRCNSFHSTKKKRRHIITEATRSQLWHLRHSSFGQGQRDRWKHKWFLTSRPVEPPRALRDD
jgi:hypothetical protein